MMRARDVLATVGLLATAGCSSKFTATIDAAAEVHDDAPPLDAPKNYGPPGCFTGTPTTDLEFENACGTSVTIPFDNCARFGECTPNPDLTITNPGTTVAGSAPVIIPMTPTMNCADVGPNIVYMTGSSNFPPLLKSVAPLLLSATPPYHVVWQTSSSCAGADALFSADPTKHLLKDIPPMGTTPANWAFFYNADGTTTTCNLDPAGNTVDVGESDVFGSTCNPAYIPDSTIAGYVGPIQTMTLVVPSTSTQRSISAEAAHWIFGNGGTSPTGAIAPWTDPTLFFVRSKSTGTNQMISRAIGIDPAKWWGTDRKTAANLSLLMQGVAPDSAEGALGVLSNDAADTARDNLRILTFQATGQLTGYYPDQDITSLDKINVRDGHYPIWGEIHLYTAVTGGVPSAAANAFITKLTVPKPDAELLDALIASGFVPQCAMNVTRKAEVGAGPLMAYSPPYKCGCYFDFKTTGATTCTSCTGPAGCTSQQSCNNGFCEDMQ